MPRQTTDASFAMQAVPWIMHQDGMRFDEIEVGYHAGFHVDVSAPDIEDFARLSGDRSPIHVDDGAARRAGSAGRVVHGFLIGVHVSRLVGMERLGVLVAARGLRISTLLHLSGGPARLVNRLTPFTYVSLCWIPFVYSPSDLHRQFPAKTTDVLMVASHMPLTAAQCQPALTLSSSGSGLRGRRAR